MNKKIVIPFISLSVGAIAFLAFYLSKEKKKKIDLKELELLKKRLMDEQDINNHLGEKEILLESSKYDW